MNTETQSPWVELAVRKPTEDEFPIAAARYRNDCWDEFFLRSGNPSCINWVGYTHWRSIKAPPPPKPERTQKLLDRDLVQDVFEKHMESAPSLKAVLLQAIYAERRAIKALYQKINPFFFSEVNGPRDTASKLFRARLDELGEGGAT